MYTDNDILFSNCSTGDVRLVGGATPNEGRIEICTNGIWASICSSRFDRSDANVVCSQLGYHNSGMFADFKDFCELSYCAVIISIHQNKCLLWNGIRSNTHCFLPRTR